ncbi:MAG: hypothetical protein ACO2PM_13195 [Pyrobaculum sp.]|jgi:uncharacterized SAM-binding protein YcdF (DUF218 family)
MNKEEKEAVAVLGIAATVLAVLCILSFQKCIVALIFAVAASLWVYVSILFAKLLLQMTEVQQDTASQQETRDAKQL